MADGRRQIIVRAKAGFILNINFTVPVYWTDGAIMSSTRTNFKSAMKEKLTTTFV